MSDHVIANGANQLVILIELKQLRFPGRVALKSEEMPFRIDGYRRDAASQSIWQGERVSIPEPQIRRTLLMDDRVAVPSPGANGGSRAWLCAVVTTADRDWPSRRRSPAGLRKRRRRGSEQDECHGRNSARKEVFHVSLLVLLNRALHASMAP